MKVERVVLDTNVLISAALSSEGKPFACLSWVLDHASLLISRELIEELDSRLSRQKFAKYLSDRRRSDLVTDLDIVGVKVELLGLLRVCRDPCDDHILELAVAGGADCIVTGDQDLLVLHPFDGLPILTPSAFLQTTSLL